MRIYKEIKNYIHNELGLTKDYIDNLIKEEIKKEVNKVISDKETLNNIVKTQIREVMNKDFEKPRWQRIFNLDTEIYNSVCAEVSKIVKERIQIKYKED